MKQYDIKLLILSRGRSDAVSTASLLPDWVEMLVPVSEAEEYKKRYANPILTIPDEIMGLGPVRNWVLDNFKENIVIMIDDDIKTMYCISGLHARAITDKEEFVQILINTAVMAEDAGLHCFGYSQTDIRKYNGTEPFKLGGWVGCIIGVIERKFRFRDDKFKVDIDYCLKCMLVDRVIWIDNRYYCIQQRDNNKGGNSAFRTQEEYQKSLNSLLEKWKGWLTTSENRSQVSIKTHIKRKQEIKL